jgi:hypothetical protein
MYREMGRLSEAMGDQDGAGRNYERAAAKLLDAIDGALPLQSRVDALQDLAEVQYATGKAVEAEEMLKRVEEEIGGAYQITPDGHPVGGCIESVFCDTWQGLTDAWADGAGPEGYR